MKRDDLYGKLQDQYNTLKSSIQDPEAFHHDVFEISTKASTTAEFHSLLAERKQQRLRELNESLESASFEIIANPSLVGTEQWAHALQLFRTRSLDSLVRYFASYLPSDHPWHKPWCGSSSVSETGSSVDYRANSHASYFDLEERPIMTDEPLSLSTPGLRPKLDIPPSPRSMTMCSDSSVASPTDEVGTKFAAGTFTPARTLSFSESESEPVDAQESLLCRGEAPVWNLTEPLSSMDEQDKSSLRYELGAGQADSESECDKDVQTKSLVQVTMLRGPDSEGSELPTPRPGQSAMSFFDVKTCLPQRRYRSVSPSCPQPWSDTPTANVQSDIFEAAGLPRSRTLRRTRVKASRGRWTTHGEPAARIHKPLPESTRSRPRCCRRDDR